MANKAIVQVCETKIDLGLYLEVRYEPSLDKEMRFVMSEEMHKALRAWTVFYSACMAISLILAVGGHMIGVFLLIASLLLEWSLIWYVSRQLEYGQKMDAVAYGVAMLFFGAALSIMFVIRELAMM